MTDSPRSSKSKPLFVPCVDPNCPDRTGSLHSHASRSARSDAEPSRPDGEGTSGETPSVGSTEGQKEAGESDLRSTRTGPRGVSGGKKAGNSSAETRADPPERCEACDGPRPECVMLGYCDCPRHAQELHAIISSLRSELAEAEKRAEKNRRMVVEIHDHWGPECRKSLSEECLKVRPFLARTKETK